MSAGTADYRPVYDYKNATTRPSDRTSDADVIWLDYVDADWRPPISQYRPGPGIFRAAINRAKNRRRNKMAAASRRRNRA